MGCVPVPPSVSVAAVVCGALLGRSMHGKRANLRWVDVCGVENRGERSGERQRRGRERAKYGTCHCRRRCVVAFLFHYFCCCDSPSMPRHRARCGAEVGGRGKGEVASSFATLPTAVIAHTSEKQQKKADAARGRRPCPSLRTAADSGKGPAEAPTRAQEGGGRWRKGRGRGGGGRTRLFGEKPATGATRARRAVKAKRGKERNSSTKKKQSGKRHKRTQAPPREARRHRRRAATQPRKPREAKRSRRDEGGRADV